MFPIESFTFIGNFYFCTVFKKEDTFQTIGQKQ